MNGVPTENRKRAACAEVALQAYAEEKNTQGALPFDPTSESAGDYMIGLLADLQHWARQNDLDFTQTAAKATCDFTAAVEEERRPDVVTHRPY